MKRTRTLRDLLREKRSRLEEQREQLENEYLQIQIMEKLFERTVTDLEDSDNATDLEGSNNDSRSQYGFAFMKHWGHSEEELAAAMESLKIRCQGNNSRALMRVLIELDKKGFIDISEVKAAELYKELCRSFGMSNIKKDTFAEAFRVMG